MRAADGALHPRTVHALADARKAIVLLNRRGWSNFVDCRTCGHVWSCPNCDVSLVLHRAGATLACHHCGHRERVPSVCRECGSVTVARHGTGTERLEHDLQGLGHEVLRLDADVRDPATVLRAFEAAERAVLVGTQMVAKGHDFPDVGLGVVVDADATLRFPDFRAEERTFALVAQLAGRAGRGARPPTRPRARPDPRARRRVDRRRRAARRRRLPRGRARAPRGALLSPVLQPHPGRLLGRASRRRALEAATAIARRIRDATVLGPAPLFRLRNRERAQLLLKTTTRRAAIRSVGAAVDAVRVKGVSLSVDVDPQ